MTDDLQIFPSLLKKIRLTQPLVLKFFFLNKLKYNNLKMLFLILIHQLYSL